MLQLLAEAAHGEESVVDAQAQAEHGRDGEDEYGHIIDARQEIQRRKGDDDAGASDQDRHAGRYEASEGDDKDQERQRKRVLLSPPDVLVAGLRNVEVHGRSTGNVGLELPGLYRAPNVVREALCLVYRGFEADERVASLTALGDET